jgi:Skp family chaperone for outer membrane proteins
MKAVVIGVLLSAGPLAFAFTTQRSASFDRASTVGYVSSRRISAESVDGKASVARVQAMRRETAATIQQRQQALAATQKQLSQAGAGASAELRTQAANQRSELEKAMVQAQNDVQRVEREQNGLLLGKVNAAVGELVKGTSVQLVVNSEQALVWGAPGIDLTSAVIERLNEKASAAPVVK